MKASDGDSSTVASSPTSDMDCTLKSGDYVVHLFSCIRFVDDVILAELASNRSELLAELLTWTALTFLVFSDAFSVHLFNNYRSLSYWLHAQKMCSLLS